MGEYPLFQSDPCLDGELRIGDEAENARGNSMNIAKRRSNLIVALLFVLCTSLATHGAGVYKFRIVAKTPDFKGFRGNVSINDLREIAFVESDPAAAPVNRIDALWVMDPKQTLKSTDYGRTMDWPQINNAGKVVIYRLDFANHAAIRIFQPSVSSEGTTIASYGSVAPGGDPVKFDIVHRPALSEDGFVAYLGEASGRIIPPAKGLYVNQTRLATNLPRFPPTSPTPVAALNGAVLLQSGNPADPIVLYPQTQPSLTIASLAEGFSELGSNPGMSDDGQIIVFYGNLSSEADLDRLNSEQNTRSLALGGPKTPALELGKGIFASIQTAAGRFLVRLCGESNNGILDPGEHFLDLDGDDRFTPGAELDEGEISGFGDGSSRVCVSNVDLDRRYATVAFLGASGSAFGVYTLQLDFVPRDNSPFDPQDPAELTIWPPVSVLKQGDPIFDDVTGQTLNGTSSRLRLFDSINNVNGGELAFWVETTAGAQAVLLATNQPYVLGLDVSHFQNEALKTLSKSLDWGAVQKAGKRFVFVKASQGETVGDEFTESNILGAKAAGIEASPYHLCGQGKGTAAVPLKLGDPIKEAQNFLKRSSAFIRDGYLPPTLDVESLFEDALNQNPTNLSLADWVRQWLEFVEQQTGVVPIVYTRKEFLPKIGSVVSRNPLFVVDWSTPASTAPTSRWTFKQYASEGSSPRGRCPGIPNTGDPNKGDPPRVGVDLDSFNGDLGELRGMTQFGPFVQISGINWSPLSFAPGIFAFQIFSATVKSATVQVSTDFQHWSDLGTVTVGPSRIGTYTDLGASGSTLRLYRIVY